MLVWLARSADEPRADDAWEHLVPAGRVYCIASGWYNEPKATLLIRVGVDEAKVVRMVDASRLIVTNTKHGLKLDTYDSGVTMEDFPDPGAVPGHDTIPMAIRAESFADRGPTEEVVVPRSSEAREVSLVRPHADTVDSADMGAQIEGEGAVAATNAGAGPDVADAPAVTLPAVAPAARPHECVLEPRDEVPEHKVAEAAGAGCEAQAGAADGEEVDPERV